MNTKAKIQFFNALLMVLSILMMSPLKAADLALSDTPLFLTSVQPNVMVMLDNSGSMKVQMYPSAYDNSQDYFGIFEATRNYIYDASIPVNPAGYASFLGGAYNVAVDLTETGAFVESNCTPSLVDISCWSGRYLNWLTTKRIDSSRMVLVGGKLESETAFNYGSNLNYKIVANNEYADRKFTEANANSALYSPIPNGVAAVVDSPARINGGNMLSTYSPYAKIFASGSGGGLIYDSANSQIGEFGAVDVRGKVDNLGVLTEASWVTVTLQGTYSSIPAVVAGPPTFNGADPGVVRIRNVTTSSFQINMQEWEYKDGNHTTETINYMVLKKGHHTLPGGLEIDAGSVVTNDEYANYSSGAVTQSDSVSFNSSLTSPLVITSVITYNDITAVASRVREVSNTGFKVAMQEEQDLGGHGDETISYIAIEQGSVTDSSNSPNWSLQSDKGNNVDENRETITFGSAFSGSPFVIAGMQGITGSDPAVLRLDSTSTTGFEIHVEEEKSTDSEVGHSDEDIGYIALEGISADFNVALVVENKPSGLLQDIESKVRLGISFYRYDPTVNDIYNGNTIPGGTMKFKIPLNPFVKKPTDTSLPSAEQGYRATDLTGYIGPTTMVDISDAIQHYPLVWGTTPLAENLWEVIQYFEQDDPHYTDVVTGFKDFDKADINNPERDPYYYASHGRKLECAKSSVIVFTDGFPFKDADVPSFVQDYDEDNHVEDVTNTNPNIQGKDNLDDVAYWGYCNKSSGACDAATGGSRDLRTDISNVIDVNGNVIPQFLKVYTVGFADGSIRPVLQDTADNAGGQAYAAEDGLALKAALEEAFTAAIDDSSASAVAVTTGSITSKTAVFQARFNSNNWTGTLLAFPVNSDGSLGSQVSASNIPAAASRILITHNGTQGIPFQWPAVPASPTASELTLAQQTLLNDNVNLLNYVRGIDTLELKNGGVFRNRDTLLGDIIHASPAFVGATVEQIYPDNWGTSAPENSFPFSSFKATIQALNSNAGRTPVVYAASNDGMLHAFNAKILPDANNDGVPEFPTAFGSEVFAYVPNITIDKLAGLSNPNYAHLYSVDGSPTVSDAFFNSAWHTVLVAGLRGGGQGIYALDVTDPADYSTEANAAAKVLWEFTDNDDNGDDSDGNVGEKGDNDLGFTFSRPNIVRMQNGVWAAVFGNGYNNMVADSSSSSTGNAVLYIVNLETGALIKKIDTGVGISDAASGGKPNGLSTVAPVDIDGDSIVDFIYGGDLYGNLWKFDVSNANPVDLTSPWKVSFTVGSSPAVPIPLFTACESSPCTSANHQPITVRPQVGRKEKAEGYMVYFGTGKYIETTDNTQTGQLTQSFYAIWDKAQSTLTSFNRSNLLDQSILLEISQGFDTDNDPSTGVLDPITGLPDPDGFDTFFDLRVTSNNTISDSKSGWFMDLVNTDSVVNPTLNNYGERQVSDPVLRNGRIIFTTLIPSEDPCESGGSGWLMELDAVDGARLPFSPFDLNGDKAFDVQDFVEIDSDNDGVLDLKVPVSGKKSKVGIISAPSVVDDDDKEYKYNSGSSGDIEVTRENPGLDYTGRQSWNNIDF